MKTIICTTPINHLKGLKEKLKNKGNLIYKPKIKVYLRTYKDKSL